MIVCVKIQRQIVNGSNGVHWCEHEHWYVGQDRVNRTSIVCTDSAFNHDEAKCPHIKVDATEYAGMSVFELLRKMFGDGINTGA